MIQYPLLSAYINQSFLELVENIGLTTKANFHGRH